MSKYTGWQNAEMQAPASSYILLLPLACTSVHAQAFHRNGNILAMKCSLDKEA